MAGELAKRVAVAIIGIPIGIFIIYLGGWYLAGLLSVIAALGALEFYRLARATGSDPFDLPGAAGAAIILLSAASVPPALAGVTTWNTVVALLLLFTTLAIWRRWPDAKPGPAISSTIAGVLFVGGTLSYAIWLRQWPMHSLQEPRAGADPMSDAWLGTALVAFPLLITWINDSLAYFVGRAIGKHKLIPRVSPGKTREGAAAGLVGGITTAVLLGRVIGPQSNIDVSLWIWAAAGAVVAAAAQVGDLAESLLKREAGVKDSGTLLPGHGGVLDRFDALFFAIPVAYWLLSWMGLR